MMKFLKRFYLGLILVFLYVPIGVLIVQSFNAGKSRVKWEGFSLRWYEELFHDARIMNALYVTVSIALLAMIAATILGTLAAIGIYSMKKRPQALMMTLTNLPNTMPDIVTGISLMLLFLFTKVERGYITMLLAHIAFDTPYVILSVLPKLKQMNKHTYEAALDLGATPAYAITHVIIPECKQGIITGAMLAFTLSIDDFTISYFTTSPLIQNLSTLIYSAARKGIEPSLNALSALMFIALLILLLIVNHRTAESK
ncbi:MAG: ABC transporter permease [Clostridia bacterium]|nr:ABC transporter permease [Clostridia bacterium]